LFGLKAAALIQEPNECLNKVVKKSCLVKSQQRSEVIQWNKALFWLAKESMIEVSASGFRVFQGTVWVQSKEEINFTTSYTEGHFAGDLWIDHEMSKTHIRHLSGDLELHLKGNGELVVLPVGFENWYAGLQSDRQVFQGVLSPISSAQTLGVWLKQFRVPSNIATSEWHKWSEEWKGNVELGGQVYQASANRHIASVQKSERFRENQAERRRQESSRLRQLYRSKNGLEAFSPSF
jgi:hypothetical protein